jgi:hypothetical protein
MISPSSYSGRHSHGGGVAFSTCAGGIASVTGRYWPLLLKVQAFHWGPFYAVFLLV